MRAVLSRLFPWLLIACLAAVAVQGTIDLLPSIRDQLRPRHFAPVEPGLYRSGSIAPRLVRGVLARHGIRKVVSLFHYDASKPSHRAQRRAATELGVETVYFHLRGDGTGAVSHYVGAIAEVAEARRAGDTVLVQCASGARRSGAVVALYELLVERRPPEQVYAELDRFGSPPVAETPLLAYLNLHLREIAEGLAARGVVDGVPARLPLLAPPPADSTSLRRSFPGLQAQLAVW
jgi:hypothetical protein